MADVARLAGVSHQTVSRVLNEHPSVRDETRARVLDAIATLGYRRNSAARALVTMRSGTIGVVTTGSALYGPTSTLIAVEEAAREQGYFVSVATIRRYDGDTMHRVLEHFMDQGVEGIVVIAPHSDVAAAVDSFRAPVPVILIAARDHPGEGSEQPQVPGAGRVLPVAVDQRLGARLATEHLLGLGHATVEHLCGPIDWFDARERETGWRGALEQRGARVPDPIRGDWSSDRGYAVGLDLATAVRSGAGPTAIFAGNDQLALGLLRAFWESGVRVPDDVSVVGFDDVAGSGHFIPPLTTVRQPFGTLGRRCMAMMVDAFQGHAVRPVSIAPELVVRESTTSPRG
ncbi:LacI family DNA-binding transcriptional regulator [Cellulosimicrobium arenosum]|uniref:LacI family DNA-binding transcriptional regulator n=1 Tax=Cellulosimicrobium arenosum TaxID=2708133 RepID=A0A927GBF6_9MICO|nr:LacI family DNA-binding transcriptional regulator [Cellulosimicrobium arenosum]MBD8079455.1 LacI family DNA-binding transcriptional regulator [Cellulosimicrobium arenosum]